MKPSNEIVINTSQAYVNQTSSAIPSTFIVSGSIQAVTGAGVAGTVKLQGSNDAGYPNTPTHFTDITGASVSVTASSTFLIPKTDLCYEWIRSTFTSTSAGVQTVALIADTGVAQVSRVVCVADVSGSLNNTYFLISSINAVTKAQKNFYVWFNVSGTGTDPLLPGKTGIVVAISTNDTNSTVATAVGAALAALTNDFASAIVSTATVDVMNSKPGLVTNASNGAVSPAFTITTPTPGVDSNLNNKYFYLNSDSDTHRYYVWFNIASLGTDPSPAGLTAISVTGSAGDSSSTLGGTMATQIAAASGSADFTASNASGTVTITNKTGGPFTPASDFNTGFTFNLTTPSGSITARLKTIGF